MKCLYNFRSLNSTKKGIKLGDLQKESVLILLKVLREETTKAIFLRYITIAWSECDETIYHLDMLYQTKSLIDEERYNYFKKEYEKLSKMINSFHKAIVEKHRSEK